MQVASRDVAGGLKTAERQDWLDAMRGLAVLGMIETHTVNTLLAAEWSQGGGFGRLVYFHGLVAPTFLWIAGYAHGLGSRRRLERGVVGWPVRTLRRLGLILGLGYLIHLPLAGTAEAWRVFWGVDVLQCVAATLLGVVVVENCRPRGQWFILAAAGLLLVAAGAWPAAVWDGLTGVWPLDAWLDQSGASLFPLVPWAAFVLAGVLMAGVGVPFWGWPLLAGLLWALPSPPFISKSHPTFFFERLGWLLAGVTVVRALGMKWRFPRWLLFAGRESLPLYVIHLSLLYMVPVASWVGPRLTPWQTGLAALLLVAVSLGGAWVWREGWNRRAAKG